MLPVCSFFTGKQRRKTLLNLLEKEWYFAVPVLHLLQVVPIGQGISCQEKKNGEINVGNL